MPHKFSFALLLSCLLSAPAHALSSASIFVDHATSQNEEFLQQVNEFEGEAGIPLEVIDIELNRILEKQLSMGLPNDEAAAFKEAERRFNDPSNQELIGQFEVGLGNYIKLVESNVKAIPAVLFDGKLIVYGEEPLQALAVYAEYQARRQE